jgi:hypothetical protein
VLCVFTKRCLRRENAQLYDIASSHCAPMFHTPCWVWNEGSRTAGAAAAGIGGRVKFLPLVWTGSPQNKLSQK